MATVRTSIDNSTFVEVSTANDALVQNISSSKMKIAFSATLPAVDSTDFHVLQPNQFIKKESSLPAGNIYAQMVGGNSGFVSVS